ncbi:hypothetical protein MAE02_66880 [Microvirga aerophila]|uniref:Uncharacterized protein n=1 Tax=Microvirga aerophila TaxID=670291 RepID=A0A512C451_9HYPH|nr:hypothetical protein MAE02_66880 [Microvirga aerophila]
MKRSGAQGRNRTTDTAIFSYKAITALSMTYGLFISENRSRGINELQRIWKTFLRS